MSPSEQWRWTDEDGVQRLLDVDELRAALADGRLKPTTLVWRRGMKRWLPAASVPELAPQPGTQGGEAPSDLGPIAQATPSVPPVAGRATRPMPQNLVDIESLRKKSRRRRKETLVGTGQHEAPESATEVRAPEEATAVKPTEGVDIPPPPRMPAAPPEPKPADAAETARRRRRKITRVGGPWSTRDHDEDTTTLVRDDLDKEKAKRDAARASGDAAGGPLGHRMPAAPQARDGLSPSMPPLARSVSPPGPAKRELPSGRGKARTSRPPPPAPRQRGDSKPGAGPAVAGDRPGRKRKRSIPPPAPKHRGRKSFPPPAKTTDIPGAAGAAVQSPAGQDQGPAPAKAAAEAMASKSGSAAAPAAVSEPFDGAATLRQKKVEDVAQPAAKLPPTTELPAMDPTAAGGPQPITPSPVVSVGEPSGAAQMAMAAPPAEPVAAFDQPLEPRAPEAPVAATPQPAQSEQALTPPPAAAALQVTPSPPPAVAAEPERPVDAPPWAVAADQRGAVGGPQPMDSWPQPPPPSRRSALTVRLSVIIGAAVVVGLLLASSFLVGRLTAPAQSGLADVVRARTGFAAVPLYARTGPQDRPKQEVRACLMKRAPARWAPAASKSIPFEMLATPSAKLAIGYAKDAKTARGMIIDPDTGIIESRDEPAKGGVELSRVVPVVEPDETVAFRATRTKQAGVHNAVWVSAAKPFVIGFRDGQCVALEAPDGEPQNLWEVGSDESPTALRTLAVPGKGVGIAYRHDNKSFSGWIGEDGKVKHAATAFESTAVESGKPMIAHNGEAWSLVFAERPSKDEAAVIRWARAPVGEPLGEATPLALPPGGPGGDAIAPAIAGLSGGRWLMMWTEGERRKQRVLRAQTYDREAQPIGEALRVSPATGSFGQGTVGVKGESAAVVFLLVARRGYRRVYEIWGTVLQCQ